jgi:hypothetical protein
MSGNLRFLRFFLVLLAIFTVGRWALSLGGAPYEKTHQVFSIVILALLSSAHYAGFSRAFKGYRLGQAVLLGVWIGVLSQLVILISTVLSYAFGMETFFNSPIALNVEQPIGFLEAIGRRAGGLVVNTILNCIAATLGWWIGGTLEKT